MFKLKKGSVAFYILALGMMGTFGELTVFLGPNILLLLGLRVAILLKDKFALFAVWWASCGISILLFV
jgi:hypothetical protein